jgi:tetratricopeptide (TPR) repeat protein
MVLEFSSDWQDWLADPYAVIGVPVTTDMSRLMKRYRIVAKHLHPDRYVQADPQLHAFVTQILARLVNPAYSQVKDERGQREILALVRLTALQSLKDGVPFQTDVARSLQSKPVHTAEIFYEQQVSNLAARQYSDLNAFCECTRSLIELNRCYLQLKQGETNPRPRRTGLMNAQPEVNVSIKPVSEAAAVTSNHLYARRHYDRAKHYAQSSGWKEAITELKDAIRMDSSCSDYHSLMGFVYLKQEQRGMARVHFKQALKLNPEDKLAKRFIQYVTDDRPAAVTSQPEKRKRFGLFGR